MHNTPGTSALVVRRFDVLAPRDMRGIQLSLCGAEILAAAVLLAVLCCRAAQGIDMVVHHNYIPIMNATLGCVLLLGLLWATASWLQQVIKYRRHKEYWTRRRRYATAILVLELGATLINLLAFVAANIYVLVASCHWFSRTVQWLHFCFWFCWDTIFFCSVARARTCQLWLDKNGNPLGATPDATLHEAPVLRTNAAGISIWVIVLAIVLVESSVDVRGGGDDSYAVASSKAGQPDCHKWQYDCTWGVPARITTALLLSSMSLYVVLFHYYLLKTFRQLRTRPAREHHTAHAHARTALHWHAVGLVFFVLSILIYRIVDIDSCETRYVSWLGYLPMHLIFTPAVAWTLSCNCPVDGHSRSRAVQIWLQEFTWAEKDKHSRLQDRHLHLPDHMREPMFCFETAVKMYYFSHLVYQQIIQPPSDPTEQETKVPDARSRKVKPSLQRARSSHPPRLNHALAEGQQSPGAHADAFNHDSSSFENGACQAGPAPSLSGSETTTCTPTSPLQHTPHAAPEHTNRHVHPQQPSSLLRASLHPPALSERGDNHASCTDTSDLALHAPQNPAQPSRASADDDRPPSCAHYQQQSMSGSASSGNDFGHDSTTSAPSNQARSLSDLDIGDLPENAPGGPPVDAARGSDAATAPSAMPQLASWLQSACDLFGCSDGPCWDLRPPPEEADSPTQAPKAHHNEASVCGCCGLREPAHAPPDAGKQPHSPWPSRRDLKKHRRRHRRKEPLELENAMQLYGLHDAEAFWEQLHDTHALVAWGPSAAVVAFRGTSSWANVRSDLKIWSVPHPPRRGSFWLGTQPRVHGGFHAAWLCNGLREQVLERLTAVVSQACAQQQSAAGFQVYVTGHSLGGALAGMAAYDIQLALKPLPAHVCCYTFGAPRIGNHAFAHSSSSVVPDMWSIINDQDAVPRQVKFLSQVPYKRAGERVLINHRGDMVVRPSFCEMSVHNRPGASSVSQHWLMSYRASLAAVCHAQLEEKTRLKGGLEGLMQLLQDPHVCKVLNSAQQDPENTNLLRQALAQHLAPMHSHTLPNMLEAGQDRAVPASGEHATDASADGDGAESGGQLQEGGHTLKDVVVMK